MATKLEKTIKRELEFDGTAYMIAVGPDGLKITQKGFRKGRDYTWAELIRGSGAGAGSAGAGAGTSGME